MKLNGLMQELAERGIRLSIHSGELTVSASKGMLTAELQASLRRHKQEILILLSAKQETPELLEIVPDDTSRYVPFPLSDLQVGFYMADDPYMEFHVRPHYYCEQDIDGDSFDVKRYEWALNKSLQRHKGEIVLITRDEKLQALADISQVSCKINDFRHLREEDAAQELLCLREHFKRAQLSLDRWPWFDLEISLWRTDAGERARIHLNQNNFYTDGFGATILQSEIDRYYDDPSLELPPLQLTFRDAVLGLHALSESAAGQRAKKYWLDRLAELPDPPALPQLSGVNRRCRSRLQRRENILPAATWNSFKNNAGRNGLTPTSAVVAAYAEILSAWSGSQHFILSNMVTRRLPLHKEMRQIIGNFASLYPLEVDLRGPLSFVQKAVRLQEQILRDSNNLQWGGMQVMQALNRLKGEFGSVPCPFVVGSGLFMGSWKKADFSCLETSQTMLDHQFWELNDGRYYYVWDLLEEFFPTGMIDNMWQATEKLLCRLAADPQAWEQQCLPVTPAAGQISLPSQKILPRADGLLHDGLGIAAKEMPHKQVLVMPAGCMTYKELDAQSSLVAETLRQYNVRADELVAIVMDRGPHLLAAALGILKAGAAYVPLDPTLPLERIHYMLANSRARVVLTQSRYRDAIEWPSTISVVSADAVPHRISVSNSPTTQRNDLAYVIYTSGSTGVPKGVMIEHGPALNTIADINHRFSVGPEDKIFGVSSFSFDLSVYDVFGVLHAGATLVYPDPAAALNPAHWLELLTANAVTIWNSAPPLMSLLVETALRQQVTLPALRLVLLSGDWIPVDLSGLIKRIAPNATVVSLGGATEVSIWSIYYIIGDVDSNWTSIPYGKPLANQDWRIRDALGRPTPIWTVGDLYITGDGLARGYWSDPEKTANSFMHDAKTGERFYRTGDRGRYLPDGNIEFMGRADYQVKIQGHRIELGEIEAALREHDAVKEAVVLAQPVAANGESTGPNRQKQLIAYVVLREAQDIAVPPVASVDIQGLQKYLKQKLPAHMLPAGWSILERLPLSNNGKIDRNALAAITPSGPPAAGRSAPTAPTTDTELKLTEIWRKVLGRDVIGTNEDFFDIGGQSFDAVRCVALLQEQFKKTLSLGDIWQERSIENLARRLDDGTQLSIKKRLVPINVKTKGRPCFFVHPGGGQAIGYYDLGRCMIRPSYGLVALVEDIDNGDLASVELIARRYIRQLKEVQPHGPYTLGGWSSGGTIAFEMAAQLEREGKVVDRVIMFDSPAPLDHGRIDDSGMLCGFFEDLNLGLPLAYVNCVDVAAATAEERFNRIIELFRSDAGASLEAKPLYEIYRVFKKVVDVVREYRPTVIQAEIVVLRAEDGVVTEFAGHPNSHNPDWGWASLTTGPVYCERLRGTHHTLLRQPNVEAVARVVNGIRIDAGRDEPEVVNVRLEG